MKNEDLLKSIDQAIDDIFGDTLEKACDPELKGDKTADEAVKKAPKGQDDAKRGAGRPKQISEVPDVDEDGKRTGEYDASISNDQKDDEPSEAKTEVPAQMKKSIDDEEYAEFLEFKKAKELEAELKKAEDAKNEQLKLIKAATEEVISDLKKSILDLRKTNEEQAALIKSLSETPASKPKSVTGIQQLEKAQLPGEEQSEYFSKSQLLDAAEELVKSNKISPEYVIELDSTGYIANGDVRKLIETQLVKKN